MKLNLNKDNENKIYSSSSFLDEIKNFLNKNNSKTETFFSIDRFIGKFAVCENLTTGEFTNIPTVLLPNNVKPGDIIKKDKLNRFTIDKEKTKTEKQEIQNLARKLFKKKDS